MSNKQQGGHLDKLNTKEQAPMNLEEWQEKLYQENSSSDDKEAERIIERRMYWVTIEHLIARTWQAAQASAALVRQAHHEEELAKKDAEIERLRKGFQADRNKFVVKDSYDIVIKRNERQEKENAALRSQVEELQGKLVAVEKANKRLLIQVQKSSWMSHYSIEWLGDYFLTDSKFNQDGSLAVR